MFRKLLPPLLLLAPLPALASEGGSAQTVIGAAALMVVITAVLIGVKRSWGVAFGAIVGIVVAGYLTWQHNEAAGASICNVNSTWNCDVVNRSVYSEVGGVPIALFGVAFYAVMAWLAIRHATEGATRAPAVMTALAGTAVAVDVFLAYASSTLGSWCALCATSWALNLLLLVGSFLLWRAQPDRPSPVDALMGEGGGVAVVGLLTLVLGGVASRMGGVSETLAAGGSSTSGDAAVDISSTYEQVRGKIELDGTEPVYGDPNAKYTLVEWADFECPHCAIMAEELPKVLAENKDVKLLFKNYPISDKCNQFVEGERHADACNAAAAGECARLQGKFWDLNHQMFKNQTFLGKEDIRFMAERLGLDMPTFETCMADPATAEAVKQDVAAGGLAQINGTPSIFLKGGFGDDWVRVVGGREQMNALFAALRSGKPLPPPRPPSDQ